MGRDIKSETVHPHWTLHRVQNDTVTSATHLRSFIPVNQTQQRHLHGTASLDRVVPTGYSWAHGKEGQEPQRTVVVVRVLVPTETPWRARLTPTITCDGQGGRWHNKRGRGQKSVKWCSWPLEVDKTSAKKGWKVQVIQ
jgi:hypothetical protein